MIPLPPAWQPVLPGAAAAGALLVVAAAGFPLALSAVRSLEGARRVRAQIADAALLAARLPAEQEGLKDAEARSLALKRRLGSGASVAHVLETLRKHAKAMQVELAVVQPNANDEPDALWRAGEDLAFRGVPLSLQLTGRYRQIGEFLGALNETSFLSSVRSYSLVPVGASDPRLRAEVSLLVYLTERAAS